MTPLEATECLTQCNKYAAAGATPPDELIGDLQLVVKYFKDGGKE